MRKAAMGVRFYLNKRSSTRFKPVGVALVAMRGERQFKVLTSVTVKPSEWATNALWEFLSDTQCALARYLDLYGFEHVRRPEPPPPKAKRRRPPAPRKRRGRTKAQMPYVDHVPKLVEEAEKAARAGAVQN